jgi:hypothetical protein
LTLRRSCAPNHRPRALKAIAMTRKLAFVALPAVLAASALFPQTAQASWLNLADGQYAVDLSCTFSTTIACPGVIQGTLTVQGAGITEFDFTINGQHFDGDPGEFTFANVIASFDGSQETLSPFSFLSLRYITAGSAGAFGTGDRWWVYCDNASSTTCTPDTQGLWSATLINAVPEPAPLALLAAAAAAGALLQRRTRPAHR